MFKHNLPNILNLRHQKLPSVVEQLVHFIWLASVIVFLLSQHKGFLIEQSGGFWFIEGQLKGTQNFLALYEDLNQKVGYLIELFAGGKTEFGAMLDLEILLNVFDGGFAKAFADRDVVVAELIHVEKGG